MVGTSGELLWWVIVVVSVVVQASHKTSLSSFLAS